jgi:hypothetical protein
MKVLMSIDGTSVLPTAEVIHESDSVAHKSQYGDTRITQRLCALQRCTAQRYKLSLFLA